MSDFFAVKSTFASEIRKRDSESIHFDAVIFLDNSFHVNIIKNYL